MKSFTRTEYRVIVENLSSRVSWQDLKVNLLFIDKDVILSCKVSWQDLKVNLLYIDTDVILSCKVS